MTSADGTTILALIIAARPDLFRGTPVALNRGDTL
jgi:hypothetical protein